MKKILGKQLRLIHLKISVELNFYENKKHFISFVVTQFVNLYSVSQHSRPAFEYQCHSIREFNILVTASICTAKKPCFL